MAGELATAFFSMQLRGAQLGYSAQELEGLWLFESIRHFAFYLYGRKFKVVTDHRSLESLMNAQQHNRRLYNWVIKLTEFDFVVEYRKGRDDVVADCLSRREGECIKDGEKTSSKEGVDVGCGSSHMNREEERIMNVMCVHRNDHKLFVA